MTPSCARTGCDRLAVATFTFDAPACLVWLDPARPGIPGAGRLCARHADTFTPPRGWQVQDRRPAAPRLWSERPVVAAVARPHPPRATRSAVVERGEPAATLPFAAGAPAGAAAADDLDAGRFDEVLDARTPLLARAFLAARRP